MALLLPFRTDLERVSQTYIPDSKSMLQIFASLTFQTLHQTQPILLTLSVVTHSAVVAGFCGGYDASMGGGISYTCQQKNQAPSFHQHTISVFGICEYQTQKLVLKITL